MPILAPHFDISSVRKAIGRLGIKFVKLVEASRFSGMSIQKFSLHLTDICCALSLIFTIFQLIQELHGLFQKHNVFLNMF